MKLVFSEVLTAVKEKGYFISNETINSFQVKKGEELILCKFDGTRIRFYVIVREKDYEYLNIPQDTTLDSIFECVDGTIQKSIEFKRLLF